MQVTLALFVWVILILVGTFFGTVKKRGRKISTKFTRLLWMTILVPFVGFVLWVLGFVGGFLLSPIFALFR